jgi:uncharacterized membrane protein YebE (DUF533 family)
MFVRGALGRTGRKHARKAQRFLGGSGGFLTASTMMAAVGVAWGLYDSLRAEAPSTGSTTGGQAPGSATLTPSVPPPVVPPVVTRVVRLAVSAANADGTLTDAERAAILDTARQAGVGSPVDAELQARQPLADIVAGVTSEHERRDLYTLAFTIVRADDGVSGAERIYLAQLAHALGLSAEAAASIERDISTAIDAAGPAPA